MANIWKDAKGNTFVTLDPATLTPACQAAFSKCTTTYDANKAAIAELTMAVSKELKKPVKVGFTRFGTLYVTSAKPAGNGASGKGVALNDLAAAFA